jgi:sulfur carrier protein ThiS
VIVLLIKVTLLPHNKEIQEVEMVQGTTCQDLLEKLELAYDAHIITRSNEPISIDEELRDSDDIGIIKVVSGG